MVWPGVQRDDGRAFHEWIYHLASHTRGLTMTRPSQSRTPSSRSLRLMLLARLLLKFN